MPKKELKVFGAFRSGSNLVRALLELNFNVLVHNNNYAYKHIPVPADFRDGAYKPFPLGIVSIVKDPFAFIDSAFRYCTRNNFLNIDAGRTFDEFCYQRFIVFDGEFDEFPRYWFANPAEYWNSIYHNLLSLPDQQNVYVRYEDLLENMAPEIRKIGKKFGLRRKKGKFILPSGVTINLADPERSSATDYFQDNAFERKEYYLEHKYMDRFSDTQKDFIFSVLDHELLQSLSYPLGRAIPEIQASKTSFASDLRELIRLGQGRIPEPESNLKLERDAASKAAQQPERSNSGIFELANQLLQKTRSHEASVTALVKNLKEEKAARVTEVRNLTETLETTQSGLETVRQNLEERERDFQKTRNDLNATINKTTTELQQTRADLGRTTTELKQTRADLDRAKRNFYRIRDSFSFKLGDDLVQALIKPGKNTVLLPYRVFKNLKQAISREMTARKERLANFSAAKPKQVAEYKQFEPANRLRPASEINVACIFDEFTTEGYRGECNLLAVSLDGWLKMFSATRPDLLFVESAWRGNGGQWEYKIGKYAGQDGSKLRTLIQWCNENSVPTVFWNKEDPVHYDKFIESAKQFDVIFTTDEDMIPAYREAAGHDKVFPLQFSAQPRLHNPVNTHDVEDKICFAGSYYLNIHEDRRYDMDEILDIAKAYGLVIYDRNYERNLEAKTEFRFPERFRENIMGSLKYSEMDRAYKGYKFTLNVNSIKYSATMFSRRVFESLACGTPVLSTWSRGTEETFGDLILMCGQDLQTEDILARLKESEDAYRKRSVQGVRAVYNRHLYRHRFATVLEKAGIPVANNPAYSVTMVCRTGSGQEVERAINIFNEQMHEQKSLLLLLDTLEGVDNCLNQWDSDKVTIFHLNSALVLGYTIDELVASKFIAFIDPRHYYGGHYLTDLVHAAMYTDAQVIGKGVRFRLKDGELETVNGEEYGFSDQLFSTSSIVDASLLDQRPLEDVMIFFEEEQAVNGCFDQLVTGFAANRYHFIESTYTLESSFTPVLIDQVTA